MKKTMNLRSDSSWISIIFQLTISLRRQTSGITEFGVEFTKEFKQILIHFFIERTRCNALQTVCLIQTIKKIISFPHDTKFRRRRFRMEEQQQLLLCEVKGWAPQHFQGCTGMLKVCFKIIFSTFLMSNYIHLKSHPCWDRV